MMALHRVPINPCLKFGESLESVCAGGMLHPGLKELFSKAYFSAYQSEYLYHNEEISEKLYDESSSAAWIVTILKNGQGNVSERLTLKERLEAGRWLLPLQVPPAAPLWLIRHYLGRLPTPLLYVTENDQVELEKLRRKWLRLATECRIASYKLSCRQKIHNPLQKRIASILGDMRNEACLILFSLITLIRNLSYEFSCGWINSYAVRSLVEYFTPAIMSRPYRPGYLTKDDKRLIFLLEYLCYHYPEVKELCKASNSGSKVKFSTEVPKHSSNERRETKSAMPPVSRKKVADDARKVFSNTFIPTPQNIELELKEVESFCGQPQPSVMVKTFAEEETKKIYQVSEPLDQTNHDKHKSTMSMDVNHANENEVSCNKENREADLQKSITIYSPENVSSYAEKEEQHPNTNQDSKCSNESEQKFTNSTIRKCQALKLACKLRAQFLAWKLAGLFVDGVTSPTSGAGYSELPQDLHN